MGYWAPDGTWSFTDPPAGYSSPPVNQPPQQMAFLGSGGAPFSSLAAAQASWSPAYVQPTAGVPWTAWLNPFDARTPTSLPLRGLTWGVLQVPGVVGAGLTGAAGSTAWGRSVLMALGLDTNAGDAFARYESNLNAGLGFTSSPGGSFNPVLSGPTDSVPRIGAREVGNAIAGGLGLSGAAAVSTAKNAANALPWAQIFILAGIAGGAYVLAEGNF